MKTRELTDGALKGTSIQLAAASCSRSQTDPMTVISSVTFLVDEFTHDVAN